MNPTRRNLIAIILGILVGSIVNIAIINMSGLIIQPPAGADVSTIEKLKTSMQLFRPIHFLFPFLAHALGTLTGAFLAAKLAAKNPARVGMVIGIFFLCGGLVNVFMLPSPLWYSVVDLAFAYVPMAWIGVKLSVKKLE